MIVKKTPKNPKKYLCKDCDFVSSNKKDYCRHLLTAKHKMIVNDSKKNPLPFMQFVCECGKAYKYDSGYYRHRKKCYFANDSDDDSDEELQSESILNIIQQNQEFKELLYEQSKQLQDTHKQLIKSNEQNITMQMRLLETFKDGKTINNTTNNNQKFNLNFFLNTTCKDAMNMSEFIENINVDFKDIENIGKNGYVAGMTDMILSRIKDLDVTKRPLHCVDLKRETMYIKDNDEWSKDTPDNLKLRNMITIVAKQNYGTVPLWREQNPECQHWDNPKYNFCVDMMRNILGDMGTDQIRLDNKVIKNISKHILVEK
jgi:hypothetical protein